MYKSYSSASDVARTEWFQTEPLCTWQRFIICRIELIVVRAFPLVYVGLLNVDYLHFKQWCPISSLIHLVFWGAQFVGFLVGALCIGKSWNRVNSDHWQLQYIPRNMHTVFALLCFVVVIHWLIFPYPSGLLHWHCGNLTIAPVPAKQPWCIWINTSCEFIMNDCITTTKQSTTKPCAYFLG